MVKAPVKGIRDLCNPLLLSFSWGNVSYKRPAVLQRLLCG